MDIELRYVCEDCGEVSFLSELAPMKCPACSSKAFLERRPTRDSDVEIMEDIGVSCSECGLIRSVAPINGRTNDWTCLEAFGGCGAVELAEKNEELPRPDDLSDDQHVKLTALRRVRRQEADEFEYTE